MGEERRALPPTLNEWFPSRLRYNAGMTTHGSVRRLTALVLVVALSMTLAAPARAEADVLLIAGLATVAVAVVILVVYLVVANTRGSRMAEETPVLVVCVESADRSRTCSGPGDPVAIGMPRELAPQS